MYNKNISRTINITLYILGGFSRGRKLWWPQAQANVLFGPRGIWDNSKWFCLKLRKSHLKKIPDFQLLLTFFPAQSRPMAAMLKRGTVPTIHPPTLPILISLPCFCRLLSLRPLVWNSTYLKMCFLPKPLTPSCDFPPGFPFSPSLPSVPSLRPPSWILQISLGSLASGLPSYSFFHSSCQKKKKKISFSQPTTMSLPG